MGVGEHLHLDVARARQVALDDQPAVAEGRDGLAHRSIDSFLQLVHRAHDPHPLAAAAEHRLQQHGEPLRQPARRRLVASISRFAASFEPIARIADAGGPMNVSPAPTTASANCAFSERKP